MEVTVLEVTNPPSKPVLAIHAGSVRRQAKLEVNQPFVIPHPGAQMGPVEVSLFQQLASQVLPNDLAPEVLCNIPIKKLDGTSSEVQLRVRRGEAANVGKIAKSEDSVGLTRDYLDRHQLQQRIQSLIQDVLREQPANPYKYMLEQLKKAQAGTLGAKQEAAPAPAKAVAQEPATSAEAMVPKPPDQPKTGGARGRGSKNSVKSTGSCQSFGEEEKKDSRELRAAAHFSVLNLLRMPLCRAAADNSLRRAARNTEAKTMTGLVLNSIKGKIVAKAGQSSQPAGMSRDEKRALVRASLSSVMDHAATLLSPQYHRALTGWARYVAYHGASKIIDAEMEKPRRGSVPTPIVFLQPGDGAWGSWLAK